MPETISVLSVQLGIFAFLALKCCALYMTMRRESSLGWLTGALIFVAALAIVLDLLPPTKLEVAFAIIFMPAALFCVSQAVRLLTGSKRRHRGFWLAVASGSVLATLLLYSPTPYLVVAILMKLLLAAATLEPVSRLVSSRVHHVLDWPLMGLLVALSLLFALRIPYWIDAFDASTPTRAFLSSPFETRLLLASGMVAALVVLLLITRGLSQLVMDLRFRSARDVATGVYNREAFREQVALAGGRGGAAVFCDIDRFKSVNDRFGHRAGDEAILTFARLLEATGAIVGRMGGDEFALFLPGAGIDEARDAMETVRKAFADTPIEGVTAEHALSASFGIAHYRRGDDWGDVLALADRALYLAKDGGRDRVVSSSPDDPPAPTPAGRRAYA